MPPPQVYVALRIGEFCKNYAFHPQLASRLKNARGDIEICKLEIPLKSTKIRRKWRFHINWNPYWDSPLFLRLNLASIEGKNFFFFFFFLIEAIEISAWRLFCSVTRSNVIRCQSNYNYNGDVKRMRKIKFILIVSLRNKILNDDENEKPGFWIV